MSVQSNDNELKDLLTQVQKGELQLPEFQRSWVWDDGKICKLIESIVMGFPMGAVMFLETGGEVNYKPRLFTGVDESKKDVQPRFLVLDGQQRLTTLFQVFMSVKPVVTCLEKNRDKEIHRYYYLDILKAIDDNVDMEDAIVSISDQKKKTEDIGRTILLDLSTREKEFEQMMFPLNLMFLDEGFDWLDDMVDFHGEEREKYKEIKKVFRSRIIDLVKSYKLPVIKVLKETSQASVCQIFENVNRGGVPLNVFELVTASLAAEGIELRQEWKRVKDSFEKQNYEVLKNVEGTDFITSMTLWNSYEKSLVNGSGVKCKKKDVLSLRRSVFDEKKAGMEQGFVDAARFLIKEGIFASANVPYNTQYVPLAAIFAYDKSHEKLLDHAQYREKLRKWYWCGVFGELYGSANETRYALDIKDVFAWMKDDSLIPDTVSRSSFQANRLLTLQTRNSAAYKGVMALLLQSDIMDFATGAKMMVATYMSEETDIHHIFPATYCEKNKLPKDKWNSIVNKTMIYAATNRSIGGVAPSRYIKRLYKDNGNQALVQQAIRSHKINFDLLNADAFDAFIIDRAKSLLSLIEIATGKAVTDRESKETVELFGEKLK
ncbi:DUF262 domain-containing protein [Fibrobacter sp.]|uniref:GmrSD restriction endonuclease domain-containing protein n=1 Tax=Fibrobacter sp. TaxID=35828 RepID=UPI00386D861F